MEWLNQGAGLIALSSAIVTVVLLLVIIFVVVNLRNTIAVQKLNFLGFFSTDLQSRQNYAELTLGNKSLNELALVEIGIRNGKVNYDLTALYRKKAELRPDTRIVVEQRSSLSFTLTEEELYFVLNDGKKCKTLEKLRLYAVDLTGNLYKGKIPAVQKLLQQVLAKIKTGAMPAPAHFVGAPMIRPASESDKKEKPFREPAKLSPAQPVTPVTEEAPAQPYSSVAPLSENAVSPEPAREEAPAPEADKVPEEV